MCRRACHTHRVGSTLQLFVVHTFSSIAVNRHLLVHVTKIHCVSGMPFDYMKRRTTGLIRFGCLTTAYLNVWTTAATVAVADTMNGFALQSCHNINTSSKNNSIAGTISVFAKMKKIFKIFERSLKERPWQPMYAVVYFTCANYTKWIFCIVEGRRKFVFGQNIGAVCVNFPFQARFLRCGGFYNNRLEYTHAYSKNPLR